MLLKRVCQNQTTNTYQNAFFRLFSTQLQGANTEISKEQTSDYNKAIPYSEIPGPSSFTFFRSLLPGGKYFKKELDEITQGHRQDYGDLFKFPSIFGSFEFITTHRPEDFQTVFRTEGQWPVRTVLDTMVYYRTKVRPDIFGKHAGLGNAQGKEWGEFRSAVNPAMAQPRNTKIYIPKVDTVAADFVKRVCQIRDTRTKEAPENFEFELNKWALEAVALIAMDTRLGLLSDNYNERSANLIQASKEAFRLFFELEFKPSLWRFFRTPNFNKLMNSFETITNISCEIIEEARERFNNRPEGSRSEDPGVLEKLLEIDPLLAKVMAIDMLFGGLDTTSSTVTVLLYLLAKNPDKQNTLRKEVMTILPNKDSLLTVENMKHLPYLRACLKESLRILPPVAGNIRSAGQDIVLQGYQIPKGTPVVMASNILQKEDEHFPDAGKFEPERWLKRDGATAPAKSAHPFIFLPFGFGPRMCVGKRFAEMEIETLIARIVRNFQIEWHHPDLKFTFTTLNVPADKLLFTFRDILE